MSGVTLGPGSPRYVQLADTLMRDIKRGRYGVGDMLPTELTLCDQYGVSRHTVREAIRRLAENGLVSRQQGVGTKVKAQTTSASYVASTATLSDLFEYTRRTRLKVLGVDWVIARGRLCQTLRCKAGQRWLKFESCRFAVGADNPISHTEIYVDPAYERIRDHFGDGSVWVYGLIEKYCGEKIVEMEQEIDSIAIPARVARLLDVRPQSPGLHVMRYYIGRADRLVSVSVNIYPQHRFKLQTRWRLRLGGGAEASAVAPSARAPSAAATSSGR